MNFQEVELLYNRLVATNAPLRIFGYGSIIWSPNFAYSSRVVGRISGYKRRFYQSSASHRGSARMPGRVATLVPSRRADTCGVAFEIRGAEAIRRALDHLIEREIKLGGYQLYRVGFQPCGPGGDFLPLEEEAYVFIADRKNPQYLGRAGLEAQARQIASAAGPAGANVEYVRRVAQFMRDEVPDGRARDPHVFRLLELVEDCLELDILLSSASSAASMSDGEDEAREEATFTMSSPATSAFFTAASAARSLLASY